jgi:flagellar hook-associated protein 3 FlgL
MMYQQLTDAMSNSSATLTTLQGEIASGLNYNTPSDAPTIMGQVLTMTDRISSLNQMSDTVKAVNGSLGAQATALQSAQGVVTKLQAIAVQGMDGSLAQTDRDALVAQVTQLKATLLDIANTQTPTGQYVFAGGNTGSVPYQLSPTDKTSVSYLGSSSPLRVQVSPTSYEDVAVPGPNAFQITGADGKNISIFQVLDNLNTGLTSNDQTKMTDAENNIKSISDHISSAMSLVGAAQNRMTDITANVTELTTQSQQVLSNVRDLDYGTALANLQKQQVLLQASETLVSQLSRLSLLNELK